MSGGVAVNKERSSNTQIAVETIKRFILQNELAAGSNHLESELAQKLGMSRTPIREATLILQAQGLLEVRPRRGVKIVSLSGTDMAEIYDILTVLESWAAKSAAERDLTDDDLSTAESAIESMDKALNDNDRERWAVADELFHSELVRLGGNARLASMIEVHNDQVRRVRALTLYLRPHPVKSNDDHRNVLNAIRMKNGNAARTLHEKHRIQSGKMLVKLLDQYGFHQV